MSATAPAGEWRPETIGVAVPGVLRTDAVHQRLAPGRRRPALGDSESTDQILRQCLVEPADGGLYIDARLARRQHTRVVKRRQTTTWHPNHVDGSADPSVSPHAGSDL